MSNWPFYFFFSRINIDINIESLPKLIVGYNLQIELYQNIKANNLELDEVICILGLNACASVVNIEEGKNIHEYINTIPKLKCNIKIKTTLIYMYNKY